MTFTFTAAAIIFQALAPQKVEREPYEGPVVELVTKTEDLKVTEASPDQAKGDGIVHRPPTRSGGRNMQESSFAFSGEFTSEGCVFAAGIHDI